MLDREADALYVRLSEAEIVESEEVAPGVIVDYDATGAVVALEVLKLASRFGEATVSSLQFDAD
ncbi:DUF2283 domain-containing protein [Carboxydochorda subterranea]|uniref:DUF2283 domain-containing protein n=1 Tax=Carboxydichorda subterranea TaxID=3109565 RepID=A0ABZ1C245_9FIRM|nr:DUF2283 domain-containing protein [Limnochorda sp. L945t]WRP18933.1 DUF2283 domain-containing protein [Limnochorda sp. L945t]